MFTTDASHDPVNYLVCVHVSYRPSDISWYIIHIITASRQYGHRRSRSMILAAQSPQADQCPQGTAACDFGWTKHMTPPRVDSGRPVSKFALDRGTATRGATESTPFPSIPTLSRSIASASSLARPAAAATSASASASAGVGVGRPVLAQGAQAGGGAGAWAWPDAPLLATQPGRAPRRVAARRDGRRLRRRRGSRERWRRAGLAAPRSQRAHL